MDAATIISSALSLGTLGVVFAAGQKIASLDHTREAMMDKIGALNEKLEKVDKALESLAVLGTLQQRVSQIESIASKCMSDIRELTSRVAEERGFRKAMISVHEEEE